MAVINVTKGYNDSTFGDDHMVTLSARGVAAYSGLDHIDRQAIRDVFGLGEGPLITYGNNVYDTVLGDWVEWKSTGLYDEIGTEYPGPGTPVTNWKSDSFSWYVVFTPT